MLILLIIVLVLLFGSGGRWAYNSYGPTGGIGVFGIVLFCLIVYLLFFRGHI